MRTIVKQPGQLPAIAEVGDRLQDMQRVVGGFIEQCLTAGHGDSRVVVWCDEEALLKQCKGPPNCVEGGHSVLCPVSRAPAPRLNFFRPADAWPILGPVLVTGTRMTRDGAIEASLTDDQAAFWMWLLSWLYFRTLETVEGLAVVGTSPTPDEPTTLRELHVKMSDRDREIAAAVMLSYQRSIAAADNVPHGPADFEGQELDAAALEAQGKGYPGTSDDEIAANAARCNCENAACSHLAGGCRMPAEKDRRLLYVGAVCLPCWNRCDEKYRINRLGTP